MRRTHAKKESKYQAKISELKARMKRMEQEFADIRIKTIGDIVNQASQYLDSQTLQFFATQLRVASVHKKGRRWTVEDKALFISLHYQSPKAYRCLNSIFILPTERTITRWLEDVDVRSGFDNSIFEILKSRVGNMEGRDRVCSLLIDEISLKEGLSYDLKDDVIEGVVDFGEVGRKKEIANQGLVFMVRGLAKKWKQPIAYFLSRNSTPASTLSSLVSDCLSRLFSIGLHVKVVICDQGVNNQGMFDLLGITAERPFIDIDSNRVFFMYDPPHLLKSVRNNLKSHLFKINDKEIKWEYIEKFYRDDKRQGHSEMRLAPKLTEKHISLPAFSKMSVSRAGQVLSSTVAAGINTYVSAGILPPQAVHTADFCQGMDDLFDSFNSNHLYEKVKKHKKAVSENSHHVEFWKEKINWLKKWEVVDGGRIKCIQGWVLTISAVIMLWEDLHNNYDFMFLFTRNLNQDPIENLFSVVRYRGGCNDTPMCNHFRFALKAAMINFISHPKESNCQEDDHKYLIEMITNSAQKVQSPPSTHQNSSNHDSGNSERTELFLYPAEESLPKQNILVYVSGFLCFKILKKHSNCEHCRASMVRTNPILDNSNLYFSYFRAMDVPGCDFGKLTIPTSQFIEFISVCEKIFIHQFKHYYHVSSIAKRILNKILGGSRTKKSRESLNLCQNSLVEVCNLFVRMRIHYAVKFWNRDCKGVPRKNRKYLKVSHL